MSQPELTEQMLPPFEGQDVIASRVRITKAGEGLTESLDLDPEALHYGETRFFVIEAKIQQINHRPDKKTGKMVREHTAVTESIAEIDADVAQHMLEEAAAAKRRRQRELAAARGEQELPLDGEDAAAYERSPEEDAAAVQGIIDAGDEPDPDPEPEDGDEPEEQASGSWDYPQPDPSPAPVSPDDQPSKPTSAEFSGGGTVAELKSRKQGSRRGR